MYEHDSPRIPHWAKYQVVIWAEDGRHIKNYQGFLRAKMELESQVGRKVENLEKLVESRGYHEEIDNWGRRIILQAVNE
jgi:hypothetical protein